MLASVFNSKRTKTNTKSRRLPSFVPSRRAQSPPSPASFVSPEIVEINDKGPFGATYPEERAPSSSIDHSITSPQIQLDFDTGESLSEWLPPSIANLPPENRTPPKRNVSLPNGGVPATAPPSKARASPEHAIPEEDYLPEPNRLFVDTSVHHARSSSDENSALPSTRKPTPSPIKIPNNVTSAKIRVQKSSPEDSTTDVSSNGIPPPLPTKEDRPLTPNSALTDDMMQSAISGTTSYVNSFILSTDSRASKYKSGGMTRQDSATLPRGEHPLHNSLYMRERRASIGSPSDTRSSSVPPVPRIPSRASLDGSSLGKRASLLENGSSDQLDAPPPLKRPKSTGRLRREQTMSMPPISPISEGSSPAPSLPNTPVIIGQGASNISNASLRSLANSVAPPRSVNLEGNASSSSLGTGEGSNHNHARAATEPNSTRQKEAQRKGGQLAPPNGAMPGTMRSSGAFNARFAVTRTVSETGVSRGASPQPSRPAKLLPIGERPSSVLAPISPQPSIVPGSARLGSFPTSETPIESPDLLDNFPVQIARERATGPPPPLPLGRRSEEQNGVLTPLYSSSGESVPSALDRQTFPETPNVFSPWTASFVSSPPANAARTSMDRNSTRVGSSRAPGVHDLIRPRAAVSRLSESVFTKPSSSRAPRVPPTPPLTGESGGSQPGSPRVPQMEPPASPGVKRMTVIEEQVASRAVSTYSTLPEPPTSGAMFTTFDTLQKPTAPLAVQNRTRGRSETMPLSGANGPHSRNGSITSGNAQGGTQRQSQPQAYGEAQGQTSASAGMSSVSSAAQAKAAEASSHRRMRSVTNPDEPLSSPPPSYAPTFDITPLPLVHPPRTGTGTTESSEPSRPPSLQSSTHLQASSSQSSIPQKRSLSPFPSPPNSSAPSSPSPGRSRLDAHASSISVEQPPPPYMEELRIATPPVPQRPIPPTPSPPATSASAPPTRMATPELPPLPSTPSRSTYGTPESTPNKRLPRSRPPLPHGPRKPSYTAAAARARAGSVSSLNSGPSTGGRPSRIVSIVSHAAPKFQSSRVNFRGLTMEAAQWTLTSQQLQHIVSSAIRQSADASAIRILPLDTLDAHLPEEIARVDAHCADLKMKYRLDVRKRNVIVDRIGRLVDGSVEAGPVTGAGGSGSGGMSDACAGAARLLEELSEVTESQDHTADELYTARDQLAQLHHLRDVHQRSALAMALRKLNSSFLKQVGEVQRLREQIAVLEAERDEAWREAQEVAQEFDDFTDRIVVEPSPGPSGKGGTDKDSITPSRRSSRVMVARKNSQRASKAGLRSMYRRSHRSSTSSNHRYSGAQSPGVWSGPNGDEEIPPVPPIPIRRDIFFPSGDLPTRSSIDSPSSELRAMVQAQRELCEMLGISLEELKFQNQGPSRRQSMSALPAGIKSPASPTPTRRNSDIITPNHQKSFKV